MLQNINLLNSVRNNVGLALDVAQVADHRTTPCTKTTQVETQRESVQSRSGSTGSGSGRGDSGKRPCDEVRTSDLNPASDRASALLRADSVARSVDAGFGRDLAPAAFAAIAAAEAERASVEGGRIAGAVEGTAPRGTAAAATTGAYSLRQKPQQASSPAKQAGVKALAKPASKMPAAIWASLVLSRV